MRILMWHVHGSYQTAFVQGYHEVLLPVEPNRGPDGRGRAETWVWPPNAVEITREECRDTAVDVVVLQRPGELELATSWLGGRRPGRDVPAIYLEHNAPQGRIEDMRHPFANRDDLTIVHVTHFNARFWDTGRTRTRVIEHGVIDPGPVWSGALERMGVVVNEPGRRNRVTGTDLLPSFAELAPIDLFGLATGGPARRLRTEGFDAAASDMPQGVMHAELARRRLYLHPYRWTSLGLSLIEAMLLGLPVVALSTTEVAEVVPTGAGVVSNDLDRLREGTRHLLHDRDAARVAGQTGRSAALRRFGLDRFLADWDAALKEVCS